MPFVGRSSQPLDLHHAPLRHRLLPPRAACPRRAGAAQLPAERAARRDRLRRRARDRAQRRAGPARARRAHPRRATTCRSCRAASIGGKLPRALHGRHLAAWSRTSGSCAPKKPPCKPWPTTPAAGAGLGLRSGRRRPGSSRERRRGRRKPKVFIKTFGCQMNEYDSDKMADVLHAAAGLRADRRRRRGRPDPVQHLLGAREGAGEGVQRPRPRQAPEGARAC